MRLSFLCVASVLVAFQTVNAGAGVDVCDSVSSQVASCMKQAGKTFAITRALHSTGTVDSLAVGNLANFEAAGISADVYAFPCRGKSASTQISSMLSYLHSHGAQFGRVWLDIETNPSSGCGWSSDTSSNSQFMSELISALSGTSAGVYASASMWNEIMGSSCSVGSSLPLWYPHYDNSPSFSDFQPFGGWSTPTMKQYVGNSRLCGVGVDLNSGGSGPNPQPQPSADPHHDSTTGHGGEPTTGNGNHTGGGDTTNNPTSGSGAGNNTEPTTGGTPTTNSGGGNTTSGTGGHSTNPTTTNPTTGGGGTPTTGGGGTPTTGGGGTPTTGGGGTTTGGGTPTTGGGGTPTTGGGGTPTTGGGGTTTGGGGGTPTSGGGGSGGTTTGSGGSTTTKGKQPYLRNQLKLNMAGRRNGRM